MKKIYIFTLSLLFVLLFLFFWVEFGLFPIIERLALAGSRNFATVIINEAVRDVIVSEDLKDGEYVHFERDGEGGVVSLSTNTYLVNLVKSRVSVEIEKRLESSDTELYIPLGNVTGIKLFSGKGPRIRVTLTPVRSVTTDITSSFLESGINQTWHRVLLQVEVDVGLMLLSHSLDCRVGDTVVISDSVIVGRVPDAYTDINKIEDELLGDVVDFSASAN